MRHTRLVPLAVLTLLALLLPAPVASADVVTYIVDPARSSLTISGTYVFTWGSPLTVYPLYNVIEGSVPSDPEGPPPPTSLQTTYGGTLTVDRDRLHDTLQITGGTVRALDSGPWSGVGASFNYGIYVSTRSTLDYSVYGTIGGLRFSPYGPPSIPADSFDASLLTMTITGGKLDYTETQSHDVGQTSSSGSSAMAGSSVLGAGAVSLASIGAIETLVIPVEVDFEVPLYNASSLPAFDLHLSGVIIAVNSVPEPTSLVLLALPTVMLLGRRK